MAHSLGIKVLIMQAFADLGQFACGSGDNLDERTVAVRIVHRTQSPVQDPFWKNPTQILAWSREPETGNHFYLHTDQSDRHDAIGDGVLNQDGHCTYSPDGEWILTDTYPGRDRKQRLMLYRPGDGCLVELGAFFLDAKHAGEFRCDLHARWSRSGHYVCVDSMHEDDLRQMYLVDVGGVLGK